MAQLADELGRPGTRVSLSDADVRDLAGIPIGAVSISDLRGKSLGATLVAGFYVDMSLRGTGFHSTLMGSLTEIPGVSAQPYGFYDSEPPGSKGFLNFNGNLVTELTGKSVYVDGVKKTMKTPTYTSSNGGITTWESDVIDGFGFVEGETYIVRIGS